MVKQWSPTPSLASDGAPFYNVATMYYVYILKSLKDGKLYIGYSGDLKNRFKQHEGGKVSSTAHRRPLELIYYEAYQDEDAARAREHGLKSSGSVYNSLVKRIVGSINKDKGP